ncbi:regulator of nonsense transcripts 3B [Erpetoichthys calabaricus]|uniref:UPF3B regulator of nonsense mediated mRNA decay n=1 Tax=Erpetoichthys calabaricus TaxID=27687 RepID=A0A8C4XCU2_ERPCA|nr:regulator of nonsense transcripts 3B [Erpetoichthys calabaricus]
MKEDKENTKPREKRLEVKSEENEKSDKSCKEKKEVMTKIVIRRLPPNLTKEQLEEQLQPLPEFDYLEFFANDTSLYPHLYSRAYINFRNQEDIVLFRDRFDGYVFIDSKGQEYPAIVEFAPFQKVAKKKAKKKDAKAGTIHEDSDFKKFLENYNGDEEKTTSTPETLLEEIEAKTKELEAKKTTPLLDFLKNKQRLREEKREERRRRELERKRLRDEERRKWREEDRRKRKEAEKHKKAGEKLYEKEKVIEPKIKLLRKPERDDFESEKLKEKPRKLDKEKIKDDKFSMGFGNELKKRPEIGHREDKGRKYDEDGRKDYRDLDRERDKRQRERERLRRLDEERRRRREHHDTEFSYRRREEEGKKEKDYVWERKKNENSVDSHIGSSDKNEKTLKDDKRDEPVKRDRLRNKDRPALQLYQPGARSRSRVVSAEPPCEDKKSETDAKTSQEKGED